jgi:hypothetical protein
MKRLIRKILREQFEYKEKIFNLLNSGDEGLIEMVKYLSEGQGYDLKELLIEYFQEYEITNFFKIMNTLKMDKETIIDIFSKNNFKIIEKIIDHIFDEIKYTWCTGNVLRNEVCDQAEEVNEIKVNEVDINRNSYIIYLDFYIRSLFNTINIDDLLYEISWRFVKHLGSRYVKIIHNDTINTLPRNYQG